MPISRTREWLLQRPCSWKTVKQSALPSPTPTWSLSIPPRTSLARPPPSLSKYRCRFEWFLWNSSLLFVSDLPWQPVCELFLSTGICSKWEITSTLAWPASLLSPTTPTLTGADFPAPPSSCPTRTPLKSSLVIAGKNQTQFSYSGRMPGGCLSSRKNFIACECFTFFDHYHWLWLIYLWDSQLELRIPRNLN